MYQRSAQKKSYTNKELFSALDGYFFAVEHYRAANHAQFVRLCPYAKASAKVLLRNVQQKKMTQTGSQLQDLLLFLDQRIDFKITVQSRAEAAYCRQIIAELKEAV